MKDDRGFWRLLKSGVLNGECAGLEEMAYPVKGIYKGYCTSIKCTVVQVPTIGKTGKPGMRAKRFKEKLVSEDKTDISCPNCGSGIVWRRIDTKRRYKTRSE